MKNFKHIVSFIFLLTLVYSCKKEDNLLGNTALKSDFLMDSEGVDTFNLQSSMFLEDSLISSNLSSVLLGSYVDPIFGEFNSEFYTQFQLSGLSPSFGDLSTIKIDSVVLGLEYNGYYGGLDQQVFEVYELKQDLFLDSVYYSFQTKDVYETNLMNVEKSQIQPDPINQSVIAGLKVDPQLRLHLDTSFARRILNMSGSNPDIFSSNEKFRSYFKGLNIRVNNSNQSVGKGGVFYFNLNDPLSKLTIYYSQSGIKKTFDLLINNECADFNHIKINNPSKITDAILNPALTEEEVYLQANKTRVHYTFNTINQIPKNAIIHSAKLELPVSYESFDNFYPSSELVASTKLKSSDNYFYSINQSATYSDFSKSYVFDLRDYVQLVVNNKIENNGVYLNSKKMLTSSERIVLNGTKTINKKQPKLNIIYTIK